MQPAVLEREGRPAKAERREHRVMCNRAQRQDRTEPGQRADLGGQKPTAVRDLARLGLVLRGDAADRIGDPRPPELETVIRMGVIIALGKSVFAQGRIEQLAGRVAGERAPGPVRAPQARRQADNQQFGSGIAEGRNRRIEPFRVGSTWISRKAARRGQRQQCRGGRTSAGGMVTRRRPVRYVRGSYPPAFDGCA